MTLPCYSFSPATQEPEAVWWLCYVISSLQLHKSQRWCEDFAMLFLLSSSTRARGSVMTSPCYSFSPATQEPEAVWWLCHVIYSLQLHKSRAKSAEWTSSCVSAVTSVCLPATSVMGKSTVRTDLMKSAAVSGNMDMISFSRLRWSWILNTRCCAVSIDIWATRGGAMQ